MNHVMAVVGTRPEIVKMAPVIRVLKVKHVPFIFVHCGQHYDYNMSHQFIEELGFRNPIMAMRFELILKVCRLHVLWCTWRNC